MMYAFTFSPSKLCLKCVKLFKNKVFVFFFAERLLFKLCKRNNFKRRGGVVGDYIKNTYLIRMLTYSKSPKQQVFPPQNAPLCNCAFFFIMWIHCSSVTAKLTAIQSSKCQQHCNSFSLWPRDGSHSPDPDYTWSKMSSSTIWLCFWAWLKSTSSVPQKWLIEKTFECYIGLIQQLPFPSGWPQSLQEDYSMCCI